jgi:MarR family transcriptional regulator, lower aerobic nicotinate degradation pathway regulator
MTMQAQTQRKPKRTMRRTMPRTMPLNLKRTDQPAPASDWHAKPLQERPGFLIRRLHQIHVTLFMEECAQEGVTPVQYSILSCLDQMGTAEQIALSRAVGLDTTNVADVLARLERRRLVRRRVSTKDKRMKVVALTDRGRALLLRIDAAAARAHERTLAALDPAARIRFMRDLARLVEANNDLSRTPLNLR